MMKNKLYIGLALMLAFLMACEDEPGDFFDYEKAITEITFENYAGFAADFTSVDNVQVTVNSSNETVDQMQVFRNLQFTGENGNVVLDRALVTTVDLSGGQGTINISLDEVFANTGATAENLNELSLDFVAEQGGQSTFRRFEVNVVDPLTIEGPEAGYNDSVATFSYNFLTFNEIVKDIEFFTRLQEDDEFVSAEIVGVNDLTGQGDFLFTLPAEEDLPVGRPITVRSIITTEQGRTFTIDREVRVEAVPLGEVQEVTLEADEEGFSFTRQEATTAADADVRLTVRSGVLEAGRLVLEVGENSNTEFVRASEGVAFEEANFQQIRDEFEEGEAIDEINLATAPTGAVYIVRLGAVPADPAEDSRRYAVMRVAEQDIADPLEDSTVTIEYRVRD
jgi:hypothetical protein